jgi:hypothetical protein
MARIRTIKPEFFTSLTLARVSLGARLTFIGLWTYCDDQGRGKDEPRLVKAAIWPLEDGIPAGEVDAHLAELAEAGLIQRYEAEGQHYLAVRNWGEHQRIDRPKESAIPAPPERRATDRDSGARPRRKIDDASLLEGKGKERNEGRRSDDKTTWVTPYAIRWEARCGKAPMGKLLAVLAPLRKQHGDAEVVPRWDRYLAGTDPKYASPHRFAETYNTWGEPDTKEMTDDFGVMRLHRRNAAGEWVEVAS